MNISDIVYARLINQHIAQTPSSSLEELLGRMGAIQAQDYRMAKWALGIRLPGSTKETIEQAITKGTIIRTHLLRPTWHFVSADDLRWIRMLTAPRIKIAMRSRHKQLGITDAVAANSNSIIETSLADGNYLSRKKLIDKLDQAGINTSNNRGSHLLLRAELDGIICSGPSRGQNYTYALLNERVAQTKILNKNEALGELARIYFNSHGPATLEDFTWWSGLTKTSARRALEMISADFISKEAGSQKYWFNSSQSILGDTDSTCLLPAYDEFIISYKNRNRIIPDDEKRRKAISNNGIFRPVILVKGQVIGIWKRSVKKETVSVGLDFFDRPAKKIKTRVEAAAERFAAFLGKKLQIKLM